MYNLPTSYTSQCTVLVPASLNQQKPRENRNDLNYTFRPNGTKIKLNPSVLNTSVIRIPMSNKTQKLLKMKSLSGKNINHTLQFMKHQFRAFSHLIYHQRKESRSPGIGLAAQNSIGKNAFEPHCSFPVKQSKSSLEWQMQNKQEEQSTCAQGDAVQKILRSYICMANHPRSEADRKLTDSPELRVLRVTQTGFGIFSHESLVEMKKNSTDVHKDLIYTLK